MRAEGPAPRHYTHPMEVITEIVAVLEPHLDTVVIEEAVAACTNKPAALRKLARTVSLDAELLTSGRPEGPVHIQRLIKALIDGGAVNVVRPRCADCGGQKPLPVFKENHQRICAYCDMLRRARPCAGCGRIRHVSNRDAAGRPFCRRCWLTHADTPEDPVGVICDAVSALQPELDRATIIAVITSVATSPARQRTLAMAIEANPALLTGQAHIGPPQLPMLIDKLIGAGADHLVYPKCPFCQRNRTLAFKRDEQRCCKRCYEEPRKRPCERCGHPTVGHGRDAEGKVLCLPCRKQESALWETCTQCGRPAFIVSLAGGRGRICSRCYQPPMATCSRCGKTRPCHLASTDTPLCDSCEHSRRPPEPCVVCGNVRVVSRRLDDGSAMCSTCNVVVEPCSDCGRRKKVVGRLPSGEALCRTCYAKHPAARDTCVECGAVERLHHHGLCSRCACRTRLSDLLRHDGAIQPHILPVFEALLAADPVGILDWLNRHPSRELLRAIAAAPAPVTHDYLDGLGHHQGVANFREGLVATGVLPPRDERMIALQKTISAQISRVRDPESARIVRSFATWHHLRRLRTQPADRHITVQQVTGVRRDVRAAVDLLVWLHAREVRLADCSHTDIDDWLSTGTRGRHSARTFLLWCTDHGHSPKGIEIPVMPAASGPEQIPDDERWATVQLLLHDNTIDTADRVAGLLVLLFGQPLSRIVRITIDEVSESGDSITLGDTPLLMPPPIDALVKQVREQRRGRALIGRHIDSPWLFPGWHTGKPLGAAQLMARLKAHGIRARPARNAALMDLANQLPTTVLSRLLDLSTRTAAKWSAEAGHLRASYAAELARDHT